MDLTLLNFYLEKINKKFDVFYYLKLIRYLKNLKKIILTNQVEKVIFDTLSSNFYSFCIDDKNYEVDFIIKKLDKDKIKKLFQIQYNK